MMSAARWDVLSQIARDSGSSNVLFDLVRQNVPEVEHGMRMGSIGTFGPGCLAACDDCLFPCSRTTICQLVRNLLKRKLRNLLENQIHIFCCGAKVEEAHPHAKCLIHPCLPNECDPF